MASRLAYRGIIARTDAERDAWLALKPAEAPLEPDLPIIDPHHHFWHTARRGQYLLREFLGDVNGGHNVVATVFIECEAMFRADGPEEMKPVGEVEFANGFAAIGASGEYGPTKFAAGIVGHADFNIGARVRDVLEAEIAAGNGRLRGIRFTVPWDRHEDVQKWVSRYVKPQQLLDPTFRAGFAELAPLGLSFDAWLYHPQLPELIDLARAFPGTTIILDHVGGALGMGPYAGRRDEIFAAWRGHIRTLAACPNVRVKLGGLGMTHFGFDFHERAVPAASEELAAAWRPYVETCIEAFGVERAMFESNFPPDKQTCGYTEIWNAFKHITRGASAAEKAALYSGTAARVYRLDPPTTADPQELARRRAEALRFA